MKKRISLLLIATMVMSMLAGCGATATKEAETSVETETVEATDVAAEAAVMSVEAEVEEAHEHTYTETITTEATCETDGEATYTCECGDSYTEPITAVGHVFENYTSNNDATYTADGTETAKCNNCDVTDTRTAEGSMLTYTYTDMDATMYAQKTVNVRSLPNTDGEKLGSLSTNDEVKVTGQCAETSWYRIEYSGGVAYVSNSYLGNDKVVVQAEAPAQSSSTSTECPYELWTMYDNGSIAWFYMTKDHGYNDLFANAYEACWAYNRARYGVVDGQAPEYEAAVAATGATSTMNPTPWYVNGQRVYQYFGF